MPDQPQPQPLKPGEARSHEDEHGRVYVAVCACGRQVTGRTAGATLCVCGQRVELRGG